MGLARLRFCTLFFLLGGVKMPQQGLVSVQSIETYYLMTQESALRANTRTSGSIFTLAPTVVKNSTN